MKDSIDTRLRADVLFPSAANLAGIFGFFDRACQSRCLDNVLGRLMRRFFNLGLFVANPFFRCHDDLPAVPKCILIRERSDVSGFIFIVSQGLRGARS
jgi:hypothetical protein